jgi:murein DD-endopeptidase MepM/ murein hydrolase activator NlpD
MSPTDKFSNLLLQLWSKLRTTPKQKMLTAAAMLSLIAFGAAGVAPLAPDASDLPVTLMVEELGVPDLTSQIQSLQTSADQFVAEERVRPGDTLDALLDRLGVEDRAASSFIRTDTQARSLANLRPGRRIQATVTAEGKLLSASTLLNDNRDDIKRLVIQRSADGFIARQEPAKLERHIEMRSGEIRSSLFAATDAAQVPDAIAMQIVEIFSSDIDFASDLRRGDRFQVIFETLWQGGEPIHSGRVLAVEFLNDGKTHQAIWFDQADAGQGGYFDADGKALKKEFLKSPLQFSRVTSGFAMRVHPISGMWKQHKGIDFAAPVGTPIRATGDGHIDFTGPHGGYGNMVVVKHSGSYSTAYAHMSHIASGLKRGARVAQGDVIGYVGTSGWSTGPHLHYEFRVNNDARDPKSIAAQQVQSLAGIHLQQFHLHLADMKHRFRLLSVNVTQLASR